MNIFEIASKRPLCFHDAEAQEFVGCVEESYKKHGYFFITLYLCIAYGEILGIRQERARRKVRFKGDKPGGQIDSFSADELEKGLQFLYKISEIRFRETLDAKHQCMADAYRIAMDLVESARAGEIGRYDLTKHGIGCSDAYKTISTENAFEQAPCSV